ncbi:glycosyltransferase [Naasia lichenicola]|uniref:glycosyltransferase n=1 Tax=Naasia lichenicola TaxID=2565933 RepID=UPI00130E64CF|nr:glycosyltransferase [Naasia lichenicola]
MIGYYVHHHGAGHLHRAAALAAAVDDEVAGFSSLDAPAGWTGPWTVLPLDTDASPPEDASANGRLHWVPLGSVGLADRMATIAQWIARERPSCFVIDVSVEVALLCRLLGVPVVVVAQPGARTDPAHTLVYDIAAAVIAPWPPSVSPLRTAAELGERLHTVGAISRTPVRPPGIPRRDGSIVILQGRGGRGPSSVDRVSAKLREAGIGDPVPATGSEREIADLLRSAQVVIAHCGQNAIAEIAAARTPAVLIAEDRPHGEQSAMARAIDASDMPATVFPVDAGLDHDVDLGLDLDDLARTIERARGLDGDLWSGWVDGEAAARAAAVIQRVAASSASGRHGR